LVDLLSFQNGITVSGNGVTDLGHSVIVSNEAASNVNFGLTTEATAVFDFGDGTQGILDTISNSGTTISHGFGSGRTYQIKVKAQTADGIIHSFDKNLVVGGTDAAFSLSRNKLLVGENVVLDGNQSHVLIGSIQSYNWSCSGGTGCFNNIQGPSITASFGTAGTYDITLTVNNAIGTNDTITKTITVLNNEPIAGFIFENANNAALPSEFRFDANTSQNIEGGSSNLIYEWTFDGNVLQKTTPITTYRFTSEGNKTVSLKVIQQVNGQRLTSESITQTIDVQTTIAPNFNIAQ
jgi:PKD repeat protein